MGSLCSSERKFQTEDEWIPEKASGRYSSLNPSRRCSFMLETPRASTADNATLAKSLVLGSPTAHYKGTLGFQANMDADHSIDLDCSNPLFTPLLIKLLRPGKNQDLFHDRQQAAAHEQGELDSPSNSSSASSPAGSPAATPMRCSLDVEVRSTGRLSWHEQRSSDNITHQDLLDLADTRNHA